MIKHSNLNDKHEIVQQITGADKPAVDPVSEAKAALIAAQTLKVKAETTSKNVEAMFSATNAANQVALMPSIAVPADKMLMSAGFVDANSAPAIEQVPSGTQGVQGLRKNTSPNFPPNPDVGMNDGIERGINDLA